MSSFGFLCLIRDSGAAVWDLARDIRGLVCPGDEVIFVDDGGDVEGFHTSAVLARFTAMQGWPDGVRVVQISTGTRGKGGYGVAANLALAEARADKLMLLLGTARIDLETFMFAREDADGANLLIAPDEGGDLFEGVIFSRSLLSQGLRAAEGQAAGGLFGLHWQLLDSAGSVEVAKAPFVDVPRKDGSLEEWVLALDEFVRRKPEALAWAISLLPARAIGSTPGEMAVYAAALARFSVDVSDADIPVGRGGDLLRQARSGGAAAIRVSSPVAPAMIGRARIRIACEGRHAHRMPLAYANVRPLWQEMAELTDTPKQADLILYAHPQDVLTMRPEAAEALQSNVATPCALLSEEPFWDTLFSPNPLASEIALSCPALGEVRLHQVNHHRSAIFDFDQIPYFLLTDPAYAERYARLFRRNAKLSVEDWRRAFDARSQRAVFMAERRPETFHDLEIPRAGIVGLCAWRTRLAEAYDTGSVARLGASWQGGSAPRQHLPDWHADKLAKLDGQAQMISALENTHQPTYLSEKLFDAFACGARPFYMASPAHRLHGLGLPSGSWINLWGESSETGGAAMDAVSWDGAFYRDYADAQAKLAALWSDADILARERARLGRALQAELIRLVEDTLPTE